jgi:protein-tyrosine kinase
MSRVHDALRKASQESYEPRSRSARAERPSSRPELPPPSSAVAPAQSPTVDAPAFTRPDTENLEDIIANAREIQFNPVKDALIIDPVQPREAPAEEFRTLRTKLDYLQKTQPLHTLVITSASPAEGKSFTAMNLAITQAQVAHKRVLLADFDFRRPSVHSTLQIPCCPGITDYLLGKATLNDILCRVAGTNLFVLPAGESVPNPLELLNLRECKALIEELRNHFDWVVLDSPPLLFAADGNLLATMCDGTILVVRIGSTTYDSVARAMQSLCENNVLGVVVNGARRGELYSKYTYYHDYYYTRDGKPVKHEGDAETEESEETVESSR